MTRDATQACDETAALEGRGCVPVGNSHRNPDGSITDRNGATIDGADRRPSQPYDIYARPFADFQTSDWRFNAIMNRIANNPGVNACISPAEREYIWYYMGEHPEIAQSVRDHDLTGTCPRGPYEAADLRPLGVR
ncbi:MAG: hypothetical protein ACHP84_01535 [Caulobacterales bacterium]